MAVAFPARPKSTQSIARSVLKGRDSGYPTTLPSATLIAAQPQGRAVRCSSKEERFRLCQYPDRTIGTTTQPARLRRSILLKGGEIPAIPIRSSARQLVSEGGAV